MEGLNNLFFNFIHGLSGRGFLTDALGIFIAEYFSYFVFAGVIWFAAFRRGWRMKLFFLIESALALILSRGIATEAIRFFYQSPRPFDVLNFQPLIPANGNSLPSGHAAFFFALATIVYLYDKRWGIWYFSFSALISVGRIFVGVHWPADIIAGAVVGVLSGLLIHFLLSKEITELKKSPLSEAGHQA